MKFAGSLMFVALLFGTNGCVLTRVVTMPMRVVGAVLSIVPIAGDTAHDAIDGAAETVDKIPL